jgi:hypothetical protein
MFEPTGTSGTGEGREGEFFVHLEATTGHRIAKEKQ